MKIKITKIPENIEIPDFAASVMAGLQVEHPQMKEGGWLPKAQWGVPSKYKDQYKEAKSVVTPSISYVSSENYGFLTPIYEWLVDNDILYSPEENEMYSIEEKVEMRNMTSEEKKAYQQQKEKTLQQHQEKLKVANYSNDKSNLNLKSVYNDKSVITGYPVNLPLYVPSEEKMYNKEYIIPKQVTKDEQKEVKSNATNTTNSNTTSYKTLEQIANEYKKGGLVQYQNGNEVGIGLTKEGETKKVEKPDANKERFVESRISEDGSVVDVYYQGQDIIIKDKEGKILLKKPRTKDVGFTQYGSPEIQKMLETAGDNVIYTAINFGDFGIQPPLKQTGIYLSSGNQASRKEGDLSKEEWDDFYYRHGDWIDNEYTGGFDQFKKDLQKGTVTGHKAAEWFQNKKNKKSIKEYGVPYFTAPTSTNPYSLDKKFGQVTYSVPRFFDLKKPETPPVAETPEKEPPVKTTTDPFKLTEVKPGEDYAKEKPLLDTWFAPDITNFVGAITDPINRYEPIQGKVNLVTPGYDLLDPTRQLAANQEQMARYQYMLENSVDPQIALSASLAASGEGFQNAANVLANVENANIGIVNQAYQQNAAIENNEIMANENARQKYIAEMAMLNENMDKAKSLKKWRVISAYNQGWHNFNKDQMMEQVLFPQVHTDNITGAVQFSGNGRAIDEYNTYNNPYGMGNSQNPIPSTDALKSYYDELIGKGFTPEFAEKFLLNQISTNKKKSNNSTEQDYAEAQGLPAQQFGGAFNINDYIGI